jgi:hypothetical protein
MVRDNNDRASRRDVFEVCGFKRRTNIEFADRRLPETFTLDGRTLVFKIQVPEIAARCKSGCDSSE